jgi:hypothetical protein
MQPQNYRTKLKESPYTDDNGNTPEIPNAQINEALGLAMHNEYAHFFARNATRGKENGH